jgi:hypothetical protein
MNKSLGRLSGTGSLLVAILLQGCGGGGAPSPDVWSESSEAPRLAGVAGSSPGLPVAYRLTFQDVLSGGASTPFYSFSDGSRGRVFDSRGRFAASLGAPVSLPRAILAPPVERLGPAQEDWSYASGISPNGIFIGVTLDVQGIARGFAVFTQTTGTYIMPPYTTANFVSTTGLVGGFACPDGGQGSPPGCPDGSVQALHWQPQTGDLTLHPGFEAVWMNDAGRMLGYRHVPDGGKRLATVDVDGVQRELGFDFGAGLPAHARFIADDGTVFLDVAENPFDAGPASAAVLIAECMPLLVGRITPRPALCEQRECIERTRFKAFSATGHAVGEHAWIYKDDAGNWQFAAETGFHWSAKDGSTAIEGVGAGLPRLVNVHGQVVVGGPALRTPTSQGDFEADPVLWKKGAGTVSLRSTLFPEPGVVMPGDRVRVIALGDGGELIVDVHTPSELFSGLLLFVPDSGP